MTRKVMITNNTNSSLGLVRQAGKMTKKMRLAQQ